jgi:hypothetical protein
MWAVVPMMMEQNENDPQSSALLWMPWKEEAGRAVGDSLSREVRQASPHLFNVCLCHIDVSVHLLKVLLRPVGLFAVPLKPPLTLQMENTVGW